MQKCQMLLETRGYLVVACSNHTRRIGEIIEHIDRDFDGSRLDAPICAIVVAETDKEDFDIQGRLAAGKAFISSPATDRYYRIVAE